MADGLTGRGTRWGVAPPSTDDEARERILDAAERCYGRLGVLKTAVGDIADEVEIHRTTVYAYFANRDEILDGVLGREMRPLLEQALAILDGTGFPERLVTTILASHRALRSSRFLCLLLDADSGALRLRVASAFDALRQRTVEALAQLVAAAGERGEVRDDVPAEAAADWIVRVVFMLTAESRPIDDQHMESVLTTFLIPSIAPGAAASRR